MMKVILKDDKYTEGIQLLENRVDLQERTNFS